MARTNLTPKQAAFVREYLVDLNASAAARRAGYSAHTANAIGNENLAKPRIAEAIKQAQEARAERVQFTADDVFREFVLIARADANDLVEYRRVACRYCYGVEHRYQRTPAEMGRDRAAWEATPVKRGERSAPFDEMGGVGYTPAKAPHAECPECFGDGLDQVHFKDTRRLQPEARRLYAGVRETQHGRQVLMHDRVAALVKIGEHLGMFRDVAPSRDPATVAREVRDALRSIAEIDGHEA